ncbi:MAG: RNA 2',3'-cyclic phosphodiesterase [Proteobacteria bacterium]|nr:RNA 2',3'-cyclic phosphodiesterase [Pseudomonadota bacterium]
MKMRSFLAFDIPEELKVELGKLIELFSPKVRGVKWVNPELVHCTIRFFGDVEEELLTGKLSRLIEQEVRHQSPFKLSGHGVGVFPNWRYPRVLWVGLQGETETVISLHARLEEAFADIGIRKDPRILRLHLTLGRARAPFKDSEALVSMVEKMTDTDLGEFTVDSLALYRSELTPKGPIYTVLERFPLGSGGRK